MDREKIQSLSVFFICVHLCYLRLKILKMTVLGVSPGVTMREARRLRNGLARDAPATFSLWIFPQILMRGSIYAPHRQRMAALLDNLGLMK